MDGQTDRSKVHDAKDRYERRVDRCTFVCQNRGLCERETEKERLMDGLVYTATGVQGGGMCGCAARGTWTR